MRRSEDKRLQTMRHVTLMAASYLFIVIPVQMDRTCTLQEYTRSSDTIMSNG